MKDRIDGLVKQFNGVIKYTPMLQDHPDWADKECVAFARYWDAIARQRHAAKDPRWNNGIPYCRNVWKD